jgi:hypothetical protein
LRSPPGSLVDIIRIDRRGRHRLPLSPFPSLWRNGRWW